MFNYQNRNAAAIEKAIGTSEAAHRAAVLAAIHRDPGDDYKPDELAAAIEEARAIHEKERRESIAALKQEAAAYVDHCKKQGKRPQDFANLHAYACTLEDLFNDGETLAWAVPIKDEPGRVTFWQNTNDLGLCGEDLYLQRVRVLERVPIVGTDGKTAGALALVLPIMDGEPWFPTEKEAAEAPDGALTIAEAIAMTKATARVPMAEQEKQLAAPHF